MYSQSDKKVGTLCAKANCWVSFVGTLCAKADCWVSFDNVYDLSLAI